MSLRGDDRAQSIQVGAAILLAFIVLAIASYQATVVPSQNEQVEYNHNQEVQSQMQDVRGGIVSVPGGGGGRSVSVQLGTTYPDRTFFVNPGPPSGTLRTTPPDTIEVRNAAATGDAGDYWDGTTRTYSTRGLVYTADYSVWQSAPVTAYENTVSYNRYDAETILESDQRLVRGKRITLVALNGSYQQASSRTVSVDLEAVSTSSNVVTVRNTTGDNLLLQLPTRLSERKWDELLEPQKVANGGHVVDVRVTSGSPYDTLEIELERGVDYRLQMAKVGVGTGVEDTEATYVVDGGGESIPENTTTEVVVEVRDEFNNPVAGRDLNFSTKRADSSVRADPSNDTGPDGTVTLVYEAPADVSKSQVTGLINVSFATDATGAAVFDAGQPENTQIEMTVRDDDVGGGTSSPVAWNTTDIEAEPGIEDCTGDTCRYNRSKGPANDKVDFSINTSPTRTGLRVDFSTSNGTVVSDFSPSEGSTDADGELVTTVTIDSTGTAELYADSLAGGDVLTLNVVDSGSNTPPTADFTYSPSNPTTGETVSFDASGSSDPDGSIASYQWDFGDGTTDTGETTSHTYSDDGSYTVTLTVEDDDGATDTTTETVSVSNRAPSASFTYSPSSPSVGEEVTFDASGSSDPDGTVAEYRWDFNGDGSIDRTTTDPVTNNTYSADGDYDVVLTVVDDDTATDSTAQTVTVSPNSEPNVAFTYSPSNPLTGETVTFDAANSSDPDGSIAYYEWDFDGDGTVDANTTSETVDYSYADDGDYAVTLTVTDDQGATNSTSKTVSVQNRPPVGNFTYSCDGLSCTFNGTSTDADGAIASWQWDLGDGTTSTSQNVTHTYSSPGNYTVNLTVTDDDGATDKVSKEVTAEGTLSYVNGTDLAIKGSSGQAAAVLFNVTNNRTDPVNITSVTIESTNVTAVDGIYEDSGSFAEVLIDVDADGMGEGMFEHPDSDPDDVPIGTEMTLDMQARISSGGNATFQFFEFVDDKGNQLQPVGMDPSEIVITVKYVDSDGNSYTTTFTVTVTNSDKSGAPVG